VKRIRLCSVGPLLVVTLAVAASAGSAHGTDGVRVQEVIEGPVQWNGEIVIDGIVIVRDGGELTVGPGTKVGFVPRDIDGDGIGDSELRVEGVIRVNGTSDHPVVFTSTGENPAPADWKYVMINHAREARVTYAIFEYAFSGVQIHYTRGTFSRIAVRHNVDGFRFSTAPVVLEESWLEQNDNGIRFEERGSGAIIRNNVITGNRNGIFAVVKCRGLTEFSGNIIENSAGYSVKLGDRQVEDLNLEGNWWGSTDRSAISSSFFDQTMEPALGRVIFEPYLESRPGAGDTTVKGSERWFDQ
jgi:hypothetical protein